MRFRKRAHAIVRAANTEDPLCKQVIHEAGTYLGIAVANLFNLLNPSLVVLGGRLTAAGDRLIAIALPEAIPSVEQLFA